MHCVILNAHLPRMYIVHAWEVQCTVIIFPRMCNVHAWEDNIILIKKLEINIYKST